MIDPYKILDISPDQISDESIRKAYLEAIRKFPPDREPVMFEHIRKVYDLISDEKKRIQLELFGYENKHTLDEWLPENTDRPLVGMEKWIAVIEEESKRLENTNPYERR